MKSSKELPKVKKKWYDGPLYLLVVGSMAAINTAIDNAKIDPNWILRTIVLLIAGGVSFAIWSSKRAGTQSQSETSPAFELLQKLLRMLNIITTHNGATSQVGVRSTINWIPALVFQAIALVLAIIFDILKLTGEDDGTGGLLAVALSIWVLAILFSTILHYRCWQALPPQFATTTPGKAIGFMFIPFYNFYWAFVSFVALPRGFVLHARNTHREPTSDPTPLGIAMAVLFICSLTVGFIPGVASAVGIASFVVWVLYYRQILPYANGATNDAGEPANGVGRRVSVSPHPIEARGKPFDSEVVPTKWPPGAPPIPTPSIYVHKDGGHLGPFTSSQVRAKVKSGAIHESDLAWYEGCAEWVSVAEVLKTPISDARPSSTQHADNNWTEAPAPDSMPQPRSAASLSAETCIIKCPQCSQNLRVPSFSRAIRITCSKCQHVFEHAAT